METLRIGISGAGTMGRIHAESYRRSGKAEVVAICDSNKDKLEEAKRRLGIEKGFTEFEEMLEEDLDAVSICTPNFLHFPQALSALERGCHVLLEKPMALNSQEAKKIVEKAEETGKILMMGMTWRFMRPYQYIRELAQEGEFGDIYYAWGKWLRRRGVPGLGGWFTTKKMSGGGPLIDIGVHVLDCILWIMDFPKVERVCGFVFEKFGFEAGEGDWPPPEAKHPHDLKTGVFDVEDFGGGLIFLEGGKVINLEVSWALNQEPFTGLGISGDKGGAVNPPLKIFKEKRKMLEDVLPQIPGDREPLEVYHREIKEFVQSVIEGRKPLATAEEGLEVMQILDALYKSAKEKGEVRL